MSPERERVGGARSHGSALEPSVLERSSRGFTGGIALLVLFGAVVPILIGRHYGALDIPRSDDWSYLLSLFRLVDSGHLGFNNWAGSTLIGQLVLAAPVAAVFRGNIAAVSIAGAVFGVFGLFSVVWLGTRLVRPGAGVFVALTVAVGPLWGPLAPTFMSDTWSFTAQMVALAMGIEAVSGPRIRMGWFAGCLAAGFLAVTIRQDALITVAPCMAGGLVAAWRAPEPRLRRLALAAVGVFSLAGFLLFLWWQARPTLGNLPAHVPSLSSIKTAVLDDLGYLRLVGLLVVPVVVLAGPVRIVRRAWRASSGWSLLVGAFAAFALVGQFVARPAAPYAGNYVARSGALAGDVLRGNRPDVFAPIWFDLMVWVSIASVLVALLGAVPLLARSGPPLSRRIRNASPTTVILALSVFGFTAYFSLIPLIDYPSSSRYALAAVPVVSFSLLRSGSSATPVAGSTLQWRGSWIALCVLAVIGFAFTADSASFDGTRWAVAQAATSRGFTARQVDGGFEWTAWHRKTGPPYLKNLSPNERQAAIVAFDTPFCVRVAVGAPVGAKSEIVARRSSSSPSRPSYPIVAYRIHQRCRGIGER